MSARVVGRMVAAPGFYEKGTIKGSKYVEQAYKLGKKVK